MTRAHASTAAHPIIPADEDDEPVIRRRGHPDRHDRWFLADDDDMAESKVHETACRVMQDALETRIETQRLDAAVYVNMAWRWDVELHTRGVDPDVMFVTPAPPNAARIRSLRAWAPGHHAPKLAIEVVSHKTRGKDYEEGPLRHAEAKVHELVLFDPERPKRSRVREVYTLQVWRRTREGRMVCCYAGEGPAESVVLGAWLVPVGMLLRVADDPAGRRLWPTSAELERAEKVVALVRANTERQRAADERQRADDERQRAEDERQRMSRMLLRHIERRIGRALTEAERDALRRRLATTDAETLDEEVAALSDGALAAWVSA